MKMGRWLLTGLLAPLLAVGCASSNASTVPDSKLVRLSVQDRETILNAQRAVNVSQQNQAAAEVARDEGKQFRKIADSELNAAKSRLDAARSGVQLGRSSRNQQTLRAAERSEDLARSQMMAARAKKDFADRLVEQREAKVEEQRAAVDVAKADVEMTKLKALKRENAAEGFDSTKFADSQARAQDRLAQKRQKVAQLNGEVESLKSTWDERRRAYNTASRETPPVMNAPAPPSDVPMPTQRRSRRSTNAPRGDVNDTPGGSSSSEPTPNRAP